MQSFINLVPVFTVVNHNKCRSVERKLWWRIYGRNYFIEVDVGVILGRIYARLEAEVSNNRAGDGRVRRRVSRMSCSVGQYGLEADYDDDDWAELIDQLWPPSPARLPHASSGKSAPYCRRWDRRRSTVAAAAVHVSRTNHYTHTSSSSSSLLVSSLQLRRASGYTALSSTRA